MFTRLLMETYLMSFILVFCALFVCIASGIDVQAGYNASNQINYENIDSYLSIESSNESYLLNHRDFKLPLYLFTEYKGYSSKDGTIDMSLLQDNETRMKALILRIFEIMYYAYMRIAMIIVPLRGIRSLVKNISIIAIVFVIISHWHNSSATKHTLSNSESWISSIFSGHKIHLFFYSTIAILAHIMIYLDAKFIAVISIIYAFIIDYKFIINIVSSNIFNSKIESNIWITMNIIVLSYMIFQLENTRSISLQSIEPFRIIIGLSWLVIDYIHGLSPEDHKTFLFNISCYIISYILACILDQLFVLGALIVSTFPSFNTFETLGLASYTSNVTLQTSDLIKEYENIYRMTFVPEVLAYYVTAVYVYDEIYHLLRADSVRNLGVRYSLVISTVALLFSYLFRRIFRNVWVWIGDENLVYKLIFFIFIYNSLPKIQKRMDTKFGFSIPYARFIIFILVMIPTRFKSLYSSIISIRNLMSKNISNITFKLWNFLAGDFHFTTATLISGTWSTILHGMGSSLVDVMAIGTDLYIDIDSLMQKSISTSMYNMTIPVMLRWASIVRDNYTQYFSSELPTSVSKIKSSYCINDSRLYTDQSLSLCNYLDNNVTQVDTMLHATVGYFVENFLLFDMFYRNRIFIPVLYLGIAYMIYISNLLKSKDEQYEIISSEKRNHGINVISAYFSEFLEILLQFYHIIEFMIAYSWRTLVTLLESLSRDWEYVFIVIYPLLPLTFICITVFLVHLLSLQTLFYSSYCKENIGVCYLKNLYNLSPFYTYFSSLLSYTIVATLQGYIFGLSKHLVHGLLKTLPWSLLFGSINLFVVSRFKSILDNLFKNLINSKEYKIELIFVFGLSWIILIICGYIRSFWNKPYHDNAIIEATLYYTVGWAIPSAILIALWLPESSSQLSIIPWVRYEFKTLILNHVLDWKTLFGKANIVMIIAIESVYTIMCNVIVPGLFECYRSEKLVP